MFAYRILLTGLLMGLLVTLAPAADKAEKAKENGITGSITAIDRKPDGSGTITIKVGAIPKKNKPANAAGEEKKFSFTKTTTVRRVKSGGKQGPRPSSASDLGVGMWVHIFAKDEVAEGIDIEEKMK